MKRELFYELGKWKQSPSRKPMLLMGARQVGKTWLMKAFGAAHYKKVAYVRFDLDVVVAQNFEMDLRVKRLLSVLELHVGFKITAEDTLIIFDEIQECPRALTSLKYFCEEAREYHIIAAGSLLGLMEHKGTGFPVGKVDMLNLYPLSFCEFLNATGHGLYADALRRCDMELVNNFSPRFTELLRIYYFVGGMPEAVMAYITTEDFNKVRKVHQNLLSGYRQDFSKHAPKEDSPLIGLIWDSIPNQLARENKKFMCNAVQNGMRMRRLESALRWLIEAGLVYQVERITKPGIPLSAYRDNAFKLFLLDVGLLATMADLPASALLEGSRVFTEYKGAMAEQYVQQELRAAGHSSIVYWATENSRTEIDFLLQLGGGIVPLEVKAETNLQAKSLKHYCSKFHCKTAVRTSLAHWNMQKMPIDEQACCTLHNIPLFAIQQLRTQLMSAPPTPGISPTPPAL